jgi:hypothetical protein
VEIEKVPHLFHKEDFSNDGNKGIWRISIRKWILGISIHVDHQWKTQGCETHKGRFGTAYENRKGGIESTGYFVAVGTVQAQKEIGKGPNDSPGSIPGIL